jgi:hypothetical protein
LRFDDLGVRARTALEGIARGKQIGTRLSPLARAPSSPVTAELEPADAATPHNRRSAPRHAYDRRVDVLDLCDSNADSTGLGRDLSLDGIRVEGYRELESGARVTLALYAGRREEPMLVAASVVRHSGSNEVAFRFEDVNAQCKQDLESLLSGRQRLESLDRGGIVMTQLVEGGS